MAEVPYARLSCIDWLKVLGKYNATEEPNSDDEIERVSGGEGDGKETSVKTWKEKATKKMRGKNKAMKRYVLVQLSAQSKVNPIPELLDTFGNTVRM